jgi:hypothetical protein
MFRTLLAAGLIVAVAAPASAAGLDHSYNRSARQQARIAHGVQAGQVTPRENAWLQRGQSRVANTQARAASDGVITNGERAHLQGMQNRQSRHIYWARHNQYGG